MQEARWGVEEGREVLSRAKWGWWGSGAMGTLPSQGCPAQLVASTSGEPFPRSTELAYSKKASGGCWLGARYLPVIPRAGHHSLHCMQEKTES